MTENGEWQQRGEGCKLDRGKVGGGSLPDPFEELPVPTSARNLFLVITGILVYSMMQACINSFNGLVSWSNHPDMSIVSAVIQSIKPALLLGTIRGVELAIMTVTVIGVGPQVWKVIGPVLGVAARSSVRFVGGLARAVRSTGQFDPNHPFNPRSKD